MNKALISLIGFICLIAQAEVLTWMVLGVAGLYGAIKLLLNMGEY